MHPMQLARVDLNLLPALAMLLEKRNVSRAAAAVGLSQSAMSRCLARLRRLLEDELLVRSGEGYRLTPAAEQIRAQLDDVLPRLQEMLLDREFDPATETRQFRMTGSDYAVTTFGATVFSRVLAAAPNTSVRFTPWHGKVVQQLHDGDLDLVFSGMHLQDPIKSRLLFTDQMVCVMHRSHPLSTQESITLDEYLTCHHLVIDITDGMQPSIDQVLAAHGTPRRASLTMPFHATAPAALIDTQLVLSIPSQVLVNYVVGHGPELCVLPAPPEISPLPYYMSWHARVQHDKGHQWLRQEVLSAIKDQPTIS